MCPACLVALMGTENEQAERHIWRESWMLAGGIAALGAFLILLARRDR